MLRKALVVGIIVLFLLVGIYPTSAVDTIKESNTLSKNGNTLYVGGSGPGNYTKIQDAVDNASDSDTVFVYDDSSPYYEHVIIDKMINLIGENRETTVIDGMDVEEKNPITILANSVKLNGFTIQNASPSNTYGVLVEKGNETIITNNIFTNNEYGIAIFPDPDYTSNSNIITNNIIKNSFYIGILIIDSTNNRINNNFIFDNVIGIELAITEYNKITNNDIKNNNRGIDLLGGNNNEISKNNIYKNRMGNAMHIVSESNEWISNYWGGFGILPKIILGIKLIYLFSIEIGPEGSYMPIFLPLPKIDVDRNPANKPNEIPEGNNQENCPLVKQWLSSSSTATLRTRAIHSSWFQQILERFPILNRFLTLLIN